MEKDETTLEGEQVQQTTEETVVANETKEGSKEEDYRAKLNANNRFLEKEGYSWKDGKWVKAQPEKKSAKEDALSTIDIIALSKADVEVDDISEVVEHARYKGISVTEALKTDYIKTFLRGKKEERMSANLAITRTNPRGVKKNSGEAFLERAESANELPSSDEEMQALVNARIARLKNKK